MSNDRWRVTVPADLSIVVHASSREVVKALVQDLLFEALVAYSPSITHLEITDFYDDEFFIDPEPLCKCGRLPECCDCDEEDG